MKKEQQLHKLIKVVFKMANQIDSKGTQIELLPVISKITNVVTINAFLIIYALQMVQFLNQSNVENIIKNILSVFSFVTVSVMLVGFWIQYKLYRELGQLNSQASILSRTRTITTIVYYICQISYFLVSFLFSISINLQNAFQIQDYMLIIFCSILFTIQSLISLTNRLYGLSSILIPFLFIIIDSSISIFALLLLSIFYLYKQTFNSNDDYYRMQKMCYIIVGLNCVWAFLHIQYSIGDEIMVSVINLGVVMVGVVGIFSFYPELFSNKGLLQDNKKMFQWHKYKLRNKDNVQKHVANICQQIIYQRYLQAKILDLRICYTPKIRNNPVSDRTAQQRSVLLYQKIKWDKNYQNTFEMNLFYFQASLSLKVDMANLVKQMICYLNKNKNVGLDGILINYQIYRLNHRLFKYYQREGDSVLQIADVIEAQKHYSSFYQQLHHLIMEIIYFWKEVLANKCHVSPEIEQRIISIKKLYSKAEYSLKEIKNYQTSKQKILFSIIKQIINNYEVKNPQLQHKVKKEDMINFQYVVLEEDRVKKISLKLLKSLGYEPSNMYLHSIRSFLPSNFYSYLQEMKNAYLSNKQRQFVIPVVDSSGCMVVKKCCIYMVPYYGVELNYLITFESVCINQILMLFNCKQERVQLFNKQFKQFTSIKLQSFNQFVVGKNVMFGSDVFNTNLGEEDSALLKKHQIIKTKIIFSNFFLRKNKIFNYKDEVTLQLQQQFKFKDYSYLLIHIQSESYREVKIEQERTLLELTMLNKQVQYPHNEYAYEQFFCKIENPYKSKVNEKLVNLKSRTFQSYFYQLISMKVIMMVLVVGSITFYHIYSNIIVTSGLSQLSAMLTLNNQYMHLWKLFSSSYSKYLFTSNPNQTTAYLNHHFFKGKATNKQLQDAYNILTAYYEKSNIDNSKQILKTYLLSKQGAQSHNQMTFNLAFRQFNLTTSTTLSSFNDFIIQTELDEKIFASFFAKNYKEVVKIMPIYQQFQSFVSDQGSYFTTLNIAGYIFISLLSLGIIVNVMLTAGMIKTHHKMYSLYKFINSKDVERIVTQIKQIKTAIGNVDQSNQSSLTTHSHLLSKPNFKLQSFQSQDQASYEEAEENCTKLMHKLLKHTTFCIILFATIAIITLLRYKNIEVNRDNFYQIANTLQKLQTDQYYLQKLYCDVLQPHIYQINVGAYYGNVTSSIIKNEFYNQKLPTIFANDFIKEEDLCQNIYIQSIMPYFSKNSSDCNNMQFGQLNKGYSQALQYYQDYLREQIKLPFTQQLSTATSKTNKIKQIIFMKEALHAYLQVKKDNLINNYSIYMDQQRDQLNNILLLSLTAWVFLLVLLIFNAICLQESMDIVINLILAIPLKVMSKMAITNYIRRQNILQKMNKL